MVGWGGGGVNRTGQRLRTTPARFFFLRCGLSFFKGCRVGRQCFLRDEGVVSFLRGAGLVGSVF